MILHGLINHNLNNIYNNFPKYYAGGLLLDKQRTEIF